MWLPVIMPTSVLAFRATVDGRWIGFGEAALLGSLAIAVAAVLTAFALVNPSRGIHDRLAGVWIGRR